MLNKKLIKTEGVHLNATLFFHDREKDTTEFLMKVKELMVEYRVPRVEVSIDAFSLLEANTE